MPYSMNELRPIHIPPQCNSLSLILIRVVVIIIVIVLVLAVFPSRLSMAIHPRSRTSPNLTLPHRFRPAIHGRGVDVPDEDAVVGGASDERAVGEEGHGCDGEAHVAHGEDADAAEWRAAVPEPDGAVEGGGGEEAGFEGFVVVLEFGVVGDWLPFEGCDGAGMGFWCGVDALLGVVELLGGAAKILVQSCLLRYFLEERRGLR